MAVALAVPVLAYVGLLTDTTGVEVVDKGYVRRATIFDYCADGTTIANTTTVQWRVATDQWGVISHVQVWSALTGGTLYGAFPTLTPVLVDRYDIARISAGGISFVAAPASRGFGTTGFGTMGYGTVPGFAAAAIGVPLEVTWDRSQHVCQPGTWVIDPAFDLVA